jgi:hypothetical protein
MAQNIVRYCGRCKGLGWILRASVRQGWWLMGKLQAHPGLIELSVERESGQKWHE